MSNSNLSELGSSWRGLTAQSLQAISNPFSIYSPLILWGAFLSSILRFLMLHGWHVNNVWLEAL